MKDPEQPSARQRERSRWLWGLAKAIRLTSFTALMVAVTPMVTRPASVPASLLTGLAQVETPPGAIEEAGRASRVAGLNGPGGARARKPTWPTQDRTQDTRLLRFTIGSRIASTRSITIPPIRSRTAGSTSATRAATRAVRSRAWSSAARRQGRAQDAAGLAARHHGDEHRRERTLASASATDSATPSRTRAAAASTRARTWRLGTVWAPRRAPPSGGRGSRSRVASVPANCAALALSTKARVRRDVASQRCQARRGAGRRSSQERPATRPPRSRPAAPDPRTETKPTERRSARG